MLEQSITSYLDKKAVLSPERINARECLKTLNLPTTKNEDWKYTSLNKFLSDSYAELNPISEEFNDEDFQNIKNQFENVLYFSNGKFIYDESKLSEKISFKILTQEEFERAFDSNSYLDTLHFVSAKEKLVLEILKNSKTDILVYHTGKSHDEGWLTPYLEIKANSFSKASIFEVFQNHSSQQITTHAQTEITLSSEAHIEHIKAIIEPHQHVHLGKLNTTLNRGAHLNSFTFQLGGKLTRSEIYSTLNEEGAHSAVHGFYGLREKQHGDIFSQIHHKVGHNSSEQLVKGILDDQSRGVFTGRIIIHRDAQQVDSSQLNKNLLLSQKAHIDTRPQLEVYADDVKCAHGATIGQLSDDEIFYLESRGIPKAKAQKILCHGFANEALEKIYHPKIKVILQNWLVDRFEKYSIEKGFENE